MLLTILQHLLTIPIVMSHVCCLCGCSSTRCSVHTPTVRAPALSCIRGCWAICHQPGTTHQHPVCAHEQPGRLLCGRVAASGQRGGGAHAGTASQGFGCAGRVPGCGTQRGAAGCGNVRGGGHGACVHGCMAACRMWLVQLVTSVATVRCAVTSVWCSAHVHLATYTGLSNCLALPHSSAHTPHNAGPKTCQHMRFKATDTPVLPQIIACHRSWMPAASPPCACCPRPTWSSPPASTLQRTAGVHCPSQQMHQPRSCPPRSHPAPRATCSGEWRAVGLMYYGARAAVLCQLIWCGQWGHVMPCYWH